jgi:putative membrane protein
MAADRTLMAWVRTALSMISFGFTIYKVLEGLQQSNSDVVSKATQAVKASPENVGLFLIGLGTVSMVMGTIEYWHNLRELRKMQYFRIFRPAFVMALVISITGLATFVSVIAKIL